MNLTTTITKTNRWNGMMMVQLRKEINLLSKERIRHSKASEEYVDVVFNYGGVEWRGWVPIEYRRTGISIQTDEELYEYLNKVYDEMDPKKFHDWEVEQNVFWIEEKGHAMVTKSFFDKLVEGGWKCVKCSLPNNPNWARRIQDLKEFGYTIATDTSRYCQYCQEKTTHLMLLPIKRGSLKGNGYETWSPELRKRIIRLLGSVDVYESVKSPHVLPDHKFSEIRWDDNVKDENSDDMSDEMLIAKFQLLTNQRNQQKREVCRNCFQTGQRGIIYGIPFFYQGGPLWDDNIPRKGKEAEKGCIGCPWYDIQRWRNELLNELKE